MEKHMDIPPDAHAAASEKFYRLVGQVPATDAGAER